MNTHNLHVLAQIFTERMLNAAGEGVILVCLVGALLWLFRGQNSRTRFAVWFLALLAMVALPSLAGSHLVASHASMFSGAKLRGEIILSETSSLCLFAAWIIGAGLLLLRLGLALWHVDRLRSHCEEVDFATLDPSIAKVLRDFCSRSGTKLCVSKQVSAPAAIGFLRPSIVFPASLLPQLSAAEIEVILLHENAHLRRWDLWTNLAQKIVTALFFFHPAVWWIDNRLTLEREMACDDFVLAQNASPRDYASFLISFAEKMHSAKGLAMAQSLVSRMHQISARVSQILDTKRPQHTAFWKPVLGAGAALLAVVVGAAPYAPQFVATEPNPSQSSQSHMKKKEIAQPMVASATEVSSPVLTVPAAQVVTHAPRPRAVLASFNPRKTVAPLNSTATPQSRPVAIRAKTSPKAPARQTFVILQTTEFDSAGSRVWTLCIWRVDGRNLTRGQLESAIVFAI